MESPQTCPRCTQVQLNLVYYDADNNLLEVLQQCPECGPRHAIKLIPIRKNRHHQLLERRAS